MLREELATGQLVFDEVHRTDESGASGQPVTVTTALGATRNQIRRLVVSDTVVLVVGGLAAGAAPAVLISQVLVAILTGVFDPPPDQLAVPWGHIAGTAVVAVAASAVAGAATAHRLKRDVAGLLREK